MRFWLFTFLLVVILTVGFGIFIINQKPKTTIVEKIIHVPQETK